MHARKNRRILANPDVVADDRVPPDRQLGQGRRRHLPSTHDVKRKRGRSIHLVVRAVHDELHARTDLTELTNHQPVADKIIMMRDVLFKIDITKIRELANNDARIVNRRPNMRHRFAPAYRIYPFRIRSILLHHLQSIPFLDVFRTTNRATQASRNKTDVFVTSLWGVCEAFARATGMFASRYVSRHVLAAGFHPYAGDD